ncbi:MAG: hypothetical protein ACRCU2_01280, partial [Planktothrix sp.]
CRSGLVNKCRFRELSGEAIARGSISDKCRFRQFGNTAFGLGPAGGDRISDMFSRKLSGLTVWERRSLIGLVYAKKS